MHAAAPPIVRAVYQELIARFGEPDIATMFDERTAPPRAVLQLDRVLVMCWEPDVEQIARWLEDHMRRA